ncbi:carbamoyltransferase [Amycolatopsis rubida]|uniref:Carbamoyltransferase n=1 Tax=Amycolatopsis rubida TaxID=112413 RepID=A0ABX0BYP5_9PSEU|nr:carbamoyltransferase C-terminal domain-containing protein [Amycolatopsis sp. M39]MYW94290.1 carbamoyltransferase [Amycolatopsis rubida]NEC59279.1 carbamoyltransferase [Amycolatopsis rubida]OAP23155.1 Decarbamoylnovobiocin carbamoyltransferase [Amycolatopsis sp. M39]
MIVVGISALYHDSACAVLIDGRLAAAAQEERFTRRRYDASMPAHAFRACLRQAGIGIADIDRVAYYEDPVARLGRQLWNGLPELPQSSPETLFRLDADRPFREIRELLGYSGEVVPVTHHESHAASAFYFSGFAESALLTADAVGEWTTTSYGRAGPDGIELFEEVAFPDSLGLFYSALTSYLGFEVNSDEYKVMGLAPYGEGTCAETLRTLVADLPGGQFRLDPEYFDFRRPDRMYTDALADLLPVAPRRPDDEIETVHQDLARSLQIVLEEILLAKARHLHERTGSENLSYAGGVALNCVANTRLRRDGPFRDLFVQPAAGDAGGCVGAAALVHHRLTGTYVRERMTDARLGPAYPADEVRAGLDIAGVPYLAFAGDETGLLDTAAELLAGGEIIGWFQGRMEFGPRSLGARSILADPRDSRMRDRINALVKKRESFRPFAPAVAADRCPEFFAWTGPAPFMLDTARVLDPAALPAISHVDGSARLQTVDAAVDPRFHGLLTAFGKRTGYPILLNTSFNVRGEPIVCTPADALAAFVRCGLDALVLGDLLVRARDLPDGWDRLVGLIPASPPRERTTVYSFV